MKKLLLKIVLILIAILFLWAGFNIVSDINEPEFVAGKGYDTSSVVNFLNDLFPPIPVTKENGFFKLWTLTEPPNVNIESDEILKIQKDLNDPEKTTVKRRKEWISHSKNSQRDKYFKKILAKRKKLIKEPWDQITMPANKDWGALILKERESVQEVQYLMKTLMERYDDIISTNYFKDYTLLVIEKNKVDFRNTPIPNLLAWVHVTKQHTAINTLKALEGDWINSVENILDNIEFGKKAVGWSRTLITNLIGKAVIKLSLRGLTTIMNQPYCPDDVYRLILEKLDDIEYKEYGTEKQLLVEGFCVARIKNINPLFQKNRTKKYFFDELSKMVESEKKPPYKWKNNLSKRETAKKGFFWWLQNPAGKLRFEYGMVNIHTIISRSFQTKTIYDMVRISAELHLKYDPSKTIRENLNSLDLYKSHIDPCSGKPYKWNDAKQVLYSFGIDKDDDGGKDISFKSIDTDYMIPILLYVK